MKAAMLVVIGVAALVLAGCGGSGARPAAGRSSPQPLRQLRSIDELRRVFNADSRLPRLIVLISPT